ncbi:MAG TPA: hypothetical protein EYP49_15445 [Anaerolineae bacterium]|nr:hypothetical protein [Anaerolineae bacterium]
MPKTPYFESEGQEREFWASHSATDYQEDWEPLGEEIEMVKPRPEEEVVGLSLYTEYLKVIKQIAERQGVSPQTLMQRWLVERLAQEVPELAG